jgi:hypothetical protein
MERHDLDKLFKMIVFFTGFQISFEYTHDTIYVLKAIQTSKCSGLEVIQLEVQVIIYTPQYYFRYH